MARTLLLVLATVVLPVGVLPVAVRAEVPIIECGAEIPPGETGVLQNDLDCTALQGRCLFCNDEGCSLTTQVCDMDAECADPDHVGCVHPPAVSVRKNATLDMNGHAIDGGPNCTAVQCLDDGGRCTVISSIGRGDVTGVFGIRPAHRTRLMVGNVDVHDCQYGGIESSDVSAKIEVTDVTSNDNGLDGIRGAKIKATNVTASRNGGSGLAAEKRSLVGRNVVVSDNGSFGAVSAGRYKLDGFVATGNGLAVAPGSGAGVWSIRHCGKLSNSTLSGNMYQDESGPVAMDILCRARPQLVATTCGRSGGRRGTLLPWSVCTDD